MIDFFRKIFGLSGKKPSGSEKKQKMAAMTESVTARSAQAPDILQPHEHGIDPDLISKNAVRVVSTLQKAGYDAFIVFFCRTGTAVSIGSGRKKLDFKNQVCIDRNDAWDAIEAIGQIAWNVDGTFAAFSHASDA